MTITKEEANKKLAEIRAQLKEVDEPWAEQLHDKVGTAVTDNTPNPQRGISSSELNSASPALKREATQEAKKVVAGEEPPERRRPAPMRPGRTAAADLLPRARLGDRDSTDPRQVGMSQNPEANRNPLRR